MKRVGPVAIKQREHIRAEHAFAACLRYLEFSGAQQNNDEIFVPRLGDLRPAPLGKFVGRPDFGEREKSHRRASDVAGEGRLVAEIHRAQAEFLVDEVVPRAPHTPSIGGGEMKRSHELPLFASGPPNRRSTTRRVVAIFGTA